MGTGLFPLANEWAYVMCGILVWVPLALSMHRWAVDQQSTKTRCWWKLLAYAEMPWKWQGQGYYT